MDVEEVLSVCQYAVKKAVELGADEAEAYASVGRETEVSIERNDVKMGKSHRQSGLGIRVFKNRALGFASVNNLSAGRVLDAVREAVKISSNTPPDSYNVLPQPVGTSGVPGLYDSTSEGFEVGDALKLALDMLREAKGRDPRISVDGGLFRVAVGHEAVANSNGIELQERGSLFTWYIMGMAIEGEEVSSFDFQFDGTRHVEEVDVLKTAREFAGNVIGSLGAKKVESFRGSLILSPEATLELLVSPIVFSVSSNNIQKGLSRFGSQLGEEVASQSLTVLDDGTLPDGLGSSSFDREGLPHRPLTLIESGILKSHLYNTYTALKEGKESTGHASGDASSTPMIAPTNLVIKEGDKGKDDLIRETTRGTVVTRFSGNLSPISGDFSGVVKGGYYVKDGQIQHSLRETLIAGNAFDILKNISAISKEKKKIFNAQIPYIKVENISITGG